MRAAAEERAGRTAVVGYGFALSAAIAYGVAQVLTRHSVTDLAPPLVGAVVSISCGTLAFSMLAVRSFGEPRPDFRSGALLFAGAGIFSATGVLGLFLALERAEVVLVAPVVSTNPLFTLLLAAIFLRGVERLTPQVIAGAVLVVAGVIILTLT